MTSTMATRFPVTDRSAAGTTSTNAVHVAGGVIRYGIDALVGRDETVAVAWTAHLPNESAFRGLSLFEWPIVRSPQSATP